MSGKMKFVAGLMLGSLLSFPAFAAEDAPLTASDRAAIVQALAAKLNTKYIEPALAERVGSAIARKNTEGGYASAASAQVFSTALAKDLREFSGDKHFGARFNDRFRESSGAADDVPSRAEVDEARNRAARQGYGIDKIERLPGNVGYIELRGFGMSEIVGPAYTAAMSLIAGTDALILDLRRNGGGDPGSVAYLISHFFPFGDERHLIDIYHRPSDSTRQIWTVPVTQRYDKPVYVLTSARTFSGGEDFAYGVQAHKRGTLVGETTGGGSNPVGWFGLGHGLVVAIPTARTTNAVTRTNWEHVGVKPDIAVPAAQALQTAHVAILRKLVSSAKDDNERTTLQRFLALAEKGESEKPIYTLRGER